MDKKPFKMSKGGLQPGGRRSFKNAGFIALLILFGLIIFAAVGQPSNLKETPYSDIIKRANNGEIKRITIKGNDLEITKKGEEKPSEHSRKEAGSSIYEQGLTNRDV